MRQMLGLVLFATILVAGTACKKSADSKYYFKYKINGNWVTYTDVEGNIYNLGNPNETFLHIEASHDNLYQDMTVYIRKESNTITTGDYFTSHSLDYISYILFTEEAASSMHHYYSWGTSPGLQPSMYKISITSITAKEIRGRFEGNYLMEQNLGTPTGMKLITEGEFVAPRY